MTQDRSALSWLKWHRGFLPTFCTGDSRLWAQPGGFFRPLRLALFAVFRIVLEAFVRKELLFACRKDELGSALMASQHSIDIRHDRPPILAGRPIVMPDATCTVEWPRKWRNHTPRGCVTQITLRRPTLASEPSLAVVRVAFPYGSVIQHERR